jgi:tetratricopeptide (TPR) repeat protein
MRAPRSPIPACLSLAFSLACVNAPARADIIHLKNGAIITADSWEVRGDDLVIRQGAGRIAVPRSEVVRIEPSTGASPTPNASPTAPPAAAGRVDAGSGASVPAGAAGDRAAGVPDDQILRAVLDLKRRINDYPLARAENTRRLVALLDQLGARALKRHDYDAALARFREALGYEAHDAGAQLGLAATYLRTDQDIFARATLEAALLDHPDDPDLHALLGDVYDGQERTEEALAEWRKAYDLRPNEVLKSKIDKLARERSIDGSYRQSEAAHFTLKYDGDRAGADLGGQILDFLEGQFRGLESRFEHYPLQPIIVILYPQRQFYEATRADANVAGLYDGKIRVPIGGLRQINAEARHVLLHELAHAFIAGKSHGTATRWLHEGLAQRIEGKTTSTTTGVALAKEFQARESKDDWGVAFSYPSALSFVEYLDDRLGFPVLVDVLQAMAGGVTDEAAFEQITRYSLKELRQAWGESLVRKYLQ